MLFVNTTAVEVICKAYHEVELAWRNTEPNIQKLIEFTSLYKEHGFNLDTSLSGHIHKDTCSAYIRSPIGSVYFIA